jgi:hypothetical protein
VAIVLGVVSENMRRRAVTTMVAMRTPCSGQSLIARAVARAAAAVLTRFVPSKTVERKFSGRSITLATRFAPFTLVLIKYSILNLCSEKKAVSELQKKADRIRQTKSSTRYSISVPCIYHHCILDLDAPIIF